jgi:ribosomal-protein-alanine N-acetyltransferase
MELASERWRVSTATRTEAGRVTALLRQAWWSHHHADWRLPGDWLGSPGFVVAKSPYADALVGCLCVAPDPPPASWVRLAAVDVPGSGLAIMGEMMAAALDAAREDGVGEVALLGGDGYLDSWLPPLGFTVVNQVVTYLKAQLDQSGPAPGAHPDVTIRPVRLEDLPRLVEIEAAAFAPMWRHSLEALALGWQHSVSFQVAELAGRVVGFQYSARSDRPSAAHLVRLTVDPGAQRQGVGSAMLSAALQSYRQQAYDSVSLNTQADNVASQRLYERFGFRPAGYAMPVWQRLL